jgi:hypothetical protein
MIIWDAILVVIIVIKLMYRHLREMHRYIQPQMSMYDYPFKTGDLVCVQHSPFLSAFTPCIYEHVGVVICDARTKQLFLWHMVDERTTTGVFMHPLFKCLQKYRQCAVRSLHDKYSLPYFQPTICTSKFNKNAIFQTLSHQIPMLLNGTHTCTKDSSYLSCFQFVIQTYTQMGIPLYSHNLVGVDLIMSAMLPLGPLIALDTQ